MKVISKKIQQRTHERRKLLFWSLACLTFTFTSLYVYFVNATALNGVRWEEAVRKTSESGATVSRLESDYLSLKRRITLAFAHERGFTDANTVTFISENGGVVSLR